MSLEYEGAESLSVYSRRRENPFDFFVAVLEIDEELEEGEELLSDRGAGEKSWGMINV